MLQRLFSRSLRGRRRLVFSVSCCKARGKHAKGRGGLPSFSSLVRARVLEISPFALKNRHLLRKLILPVWTEKFRDVSHKFKMSEYIWIRGAATERWKKRWSSVYVQDPLCNVTWLAVEIQRVVCAGLQYSLRYHAQHSRGGHMWCNCVVRDVAENVAPCVWAFIQSAFIVLTLMTRKNRLQINVWQKKWINNRPE